MFMKKTFLILFLFFIAQQSLAVSKSGTTAGQFLKIGVGGRASAMGGAFVAVANDASALFWNLSGIARLNRNEAILAHSEWLADMNFDDGRIVVKMDGFATLGAS